MSDSDKDFKESFQKDFPFRTSFGVDFKALSTPKGNFQISEASLREVSKFLPNIDIVNSDILPIAANAAVLNTLNLNDDGMTSEVGIQVAKSFLYKFIDGEHSRKKLFGCITNYAFTEFGTDREMTEEEVLKTTDPVNLVLGGVIWKIIDSDLANFIEESSDPDSENFNSCSVSWEVGFAKNDIVLIPTEANSSFYKDSIIIKEGSNNYDLYSEHLRCNGGSGFCDGYKIGRGIVLPAIGLGIGIVEKPAALVKGIATPLTLEAYEEKEKEEEKKVKSLDSENHVGDCAEDSSPIVIENGDCSEDEIESGLNNDLNSLITLVRNVFISNLNDLNEKPIAESISANMDKYCPVCSETSCFVELRVDKGRFPKMGRYLLCSNCKKVSKVSNFDKYNRERKTQIESLLKLKSISDTVETTAFDFESSQESALSVKNNEDLTVKASLVNLLSTKIDINDKSELNPNLNKLNLMTFATAAEITDEQLKIASASEIREFLEKQAAECASKAAEQLAAQDKERQDKDLALATRVAELENINISLESSRDSLAQENIKVSDENKSLAAQLEELNKNLSEAKKDLEILINEKNQAIAQKVFNTRMAYFDDKFELQKEDKEIIANAIKDLSEESYSAYVLNMDVLMSEKIKTVIAAKKEELMKISSASIQNDDKKISDLLNNSEEERSVVTAGQINLESKSMVEKYRKYFEITSENFHNV